MSDFASGVVTGAIIVSAITIAVFSIHRCAERTSVNDRLVISYFNKAGTYDRDVVEKITNGKYNEVWPKFKCQHYEMDKYIYKIELTNPND